MCIDAALLRHISTPRVARLERELAAKLAAERGMQAPTGLHGGSSDMPSDMEQSDEQDGATARTNINMAMHKMTMTMMMAVS